MNQPPAEQRDFGFVRLQPLQVDRKAVQKAGCVGEPERRYSAGIRVGKVVPALCQRVVEPVARLQHEVGPGFTPPQQPAIQQATRTLLWPPAGRLVEHQHGSGGMLRPDAGFQACDVLVVQVARNVGRG